MIGWDWGRVGRSKADDGVVERTTRVGAKKGGMGRTRRLGLTTGRGGGADERLFGWSKEG